MYAPVLKGLRHVHSYVCERLETLVFDDNLAREQLLPAGFLYGQAMALSSSTAEGLASAVENM